MNISQVRRRIFGGLRVSGMLEEGGGRTFPLYCEMEKSEVIHNICSALVASYTGSWNDADALIQVVIFNY